MPTDAPASLDFVREIVAADLAAGRHDRQVITRFPPEPNGYLHIGHAKSICLNFGIPRDFTDQAAVARTHLRFDDTNPVKEEQEYIDAIKADVRWLGFDWGEHEYYASDYFEQLYDWAVRLIEAGLAYVDDQNAEQIRQTRGTLTAPGTPSPWRERPIAENLDLFRRMRAGEFPNGSRVLRAKINMASPNVNLRDPVLYRILHAAHPRTGDAWCVYPMYDWAHGQSDWIEGVTHSICTLEFEAHRPLYDWCIEQLQKLGVKPARAVDRPRQYEFARLNLSYTMMSKRKLLQLVREKHVRGWDDPRMPTICGLRRRGFTPEALRHFAQRIGVAKRENIIEVALLEHCLREDLNKRTPRVMAVLDPLKVVITNYPEGQVETLEAVNNPEDAAQGSRGVPFARELYIERDDFMENPPGKFFRLAPGREVRLRYAYFITCQEAVKDAAGRVMKLRCTYDPATRGGDAPDGRKVKGTLHWVAAPTAVEAEVRLYDHLFTKEDPSDLDTPEGADSGDQLAELTDASTSATARGVKAAWLANLNPESEKVIRALVEPSVADPSAGLPDPASLWTDGIARYQFERLGYFCLDVEAKAFHRLIFNRTVTLRDTWARQQKKGD